MRTKLEGEWNPRVVLWAKVRGIPLEKLVREPGEDIYCPNGDTPWTVFYTDWVKGRWEDFHCLCHGTPDRRECCVGGEDTQRRFDEWLNEQCWGEK
jgi:hypothetical protein